MRLFVSQTQVMAAAIDSIITDLGDPMVKIFGGDVVPVHKEFLEDGIPAHGDYLAQYQNGNYFWVQRQDFERAYTPATEEVADEDRDEDLGFSAALLALKAGLQVKRQFWPKGQRLEFFKNSNRMPGYANCIAVLDPARNQPGPWPWTPTMGDVIANDWRIVE